MATFSSLIPDVLLLDAYMHACILHDLGGKNIEQKRKEKIKSFVAHQNRTRVFSMSANFFKKEITY